MPDRKRLAPVPLPREEPIAQAVVHGFAAKTRSREIVCDSDFELACSHAVVLLTVHGKSLVSERLIKPFWMFDKCSLQCGSDCGTIPPSFSQNIFDRSNRGAALSQGVVEFLL